MLWSLLPIQMKKHGAISPILLTSL